MRFKKNIIFVLMLIIVIISLGTECIGQSPEKWTVGIAAFPVDGEHPFLQAMQYFNKFLKEKTEGRYELDIYHSGQLGSDKDMFEGTMMGLYGMTFNSSGQAANYEDIFNIFDFPYLFSSREHAHKVLDSKIGEEVLKSIEKHNLIGLGFAESGFRNLTNSVRPVKTPSDLQGLKIRLMEVPMHIETFKTLGANATPMAWGEVFTSLAQGTIDGQENLNFGMLCAKIYEVNKYFTITEHFYTPMIIAINKDIFEALSPEDQLAVREAARESIIMQREEAKRQNSVALKKCEEYGVEVIRDIDKQLWIDAVQPLYDKYEEQYGEYFSRIREMDPMLQ